MCREKWLNVPVTIFFSTGSETLWMSPRAMSETLLVSSRAMSEHYGCLKLTARLAITVFTLLNLSHLKCGAYSKAALI